MLLKKLKSAAWAMLPALAFAVAVPAQARDGYRHDRRGGDDDAAIAIGAVRVIAGAGAIIVALPGIIAAAIIVMPIVLIRIRHFGVQLFCSDSFVIWIKTEEIHVITVSCQAHIIDGRISIIFSKSREIVCKYFSRFSFIGIT